MSTTTFYGWKLLAVLWLILMIGSAIPLYAGGVLNSYMFKDLGVSRDLFSIPMSLMQFIFGLGALFMAALIGKLGIRGTLMLGGVIGAAGSSAMATLVSSGLHAILVVGLLVGAGFCIVGGITTQVGVTHWFLRRRALAMAILLSAPGVGGFVTAPLMNSLVTSFDGEWRYGWMVGAALFLLVSVLSFLFVKEAPSELGQTPDGLPPAGSELEGSSQKTPKLGAFVTTEDWTIREVLRNSVFWIMLVCGVGVNVGMTLYFAIGIVHLQDVGRTVAAGSWALGVFGISALLAKVVLGAFGDRFDPRYIWAGMIGVFGAGVLLLASADQNYAMNSFPVLMGIGFGGHIACLLAVLGNYYGRKIFPAAAGVATAVTTCSGALAPFIAKGFYDNFGTYSPAFTAIALWSIVGAIVMIFLRRPQTFSAGQTV